MSTEIKLAFYFFTHRLCTQLRSDVRLWQNFDMPSGFELYPDHVPPIL